MLPGFWPGRIAAAGAALVWLALLLILPSSPSAWLVAGSGLPVLALVSWTTARRAGRPWTGHLRATADVHALGLVLLAGLAVQMTATHGITTDGVIYFSQLRSLLFDGDFEIAREFELLKQPPRPHHFVPIGPTLLWLPLYGLVALADAAGRGLGLWAAPADPASLGLGLPYVRAALLSSFAIGAAGLLVLHQRLREEFAHGVAFLTSALLFGATSLFWYMVYEPSMTHAASFGFVALFVVFADRWIPPGASRTQAVVLGALAGLAFLSRPQEALFVIVAGVLVLTTGPAAARWARTRHLAGWGFAGAAPLLLLQAVHGYALYSLYRFRLAGEGGYLDPFSSRVGDVLFSSWHGFLSWTPVAYVALVGTVAYVRRDWRWAGAGLAVFACMTWVNGAVTDWPGGWAFGGRRFTSTLVVLAPGLALAIEAVRRVPLAAVGTLVVAAVWWNHLLMVQYTDGLLPKDEPVDFGRIVRQQADVLTRRPYFYPFAFPANAWFAWRENLPVDRYDRLAPEPLRPAIDLELTREDAGRYLLDGWDAPGAEGRSWWIGRRPAALAVPLDLRGPRDVRVTTVARTRFEEPTVVAEVALEINGHEIGRFTPDATTPSEASLVVPAADFQRVWRAGYNRVAFRVLGVQRVDPADPRPPGPIAARLGSRPWPVAIYRLRIEPLG